MSNSTPPVFMLTTPKNIIGNTAITSIAQLNTEGYKVYPFQGVVRTTDRSKIVMDGWKKFFSMLKGNLPNGLLMAEDDLFWEEPWSKTKKKMKMDKINWLCYQKFFKEKQRDGSVKMIPVGNQFMYIPPKLIESYKEEILKAKSIHFDRWNSRLPNIYYAYKPHEVCAELTSPSATTGKVRKGILPEMLKNVGKTDEIRVKLPSTEPRKGFAIKKINGIPLLNQRDLLTKYMKTLDNLRKGKGKVKIKKTGKKLFKGGVDEFIQFV